MANEYQITFSTASLEATQSILRELSYSSSIYRVKGRTFFHFFDDDAEEEMPIATAEGLPDGIYFCDHGAGEGVLQELIQVLNHTYDDVDCEKLVSK